MSDTRSRKQVDVGVAALWASAFVILAMIISHAARTPLAGAPAQAGLVSNIGDMTVLTASGGDNEDILALLDRRAERLFVYSVVNARSLELIKNYDISQTFADARRAAGL